MDQDCEICRIIRDSRDDVIIVETDYWRVVLNPNQAYPGTAWVTARSHVGSLSELSEGQWLDLREVMKHYEGAMGRAFGAKLCNWVCLMNDAFKEAQPMPHVHWHVRPRYDSSVKVAGEELGDPNFAHHYLPKFERALAPSMLREIAERIRENW